MCGRYAAFREAQDLAQEFDVERIQDAVLAREASWNVAPTDGVPVVLERAAKTDAAEADPGENGVITRELHLARWGLLPPWAKALRGGPPLFNARLESVAHKPAFAKSLVTRRCIVPADGYFEWRTEAAPDGGKPIKTPFFIHPAPGGAGTPSLAFAGLYSWWRDPERGEDDPLRWVLSTTILTQPARDGLEAIHDREPVVLPPGAVDAWLDPTLASAQEALGVLAAAPPPLHWYEVGSGVGSVRNNSALLIAPV